MSITTVFDPPLITDATAVFNTKAFDTVVKLNDWSTQANDLATDVNTDAAAAIAAAASAVDIVDIASAAANYKGLWSSLTGALNKPASVSHNGNYWALNSNLANVTTATPGISASWQPLNVGAGGALETSSAVNIALTTASFRVQAISMTAADKSVSLPNATTLQTGGEIFVLKNTGTISYVVRDFASGYIANLDPSQMITLYLSNASTSAGTWAVLTAQAGSITQAPYQSVAAVINAVSSTDIAITQMSPTQSIVCWKNNSTGFLNACTLNLSGNTVSPGTILAVNAIASSLCAITTMSSTKAIVAYAGVSGYLNAITLDVVSGTLLSAGTNKIVNANASTVIRLAALSSTTAIVMLNMPTLSAYHLTVVSGTTITNGAVAAVSGATPTYTAIAALSSTQAIGSWVTGTGAQVATLNISGTTVTPGAVIALSGGSSTQAMVEVLNSTQAVVGWGSGAAPLGLLSLRQVDISGTNVVPAVETTRYTSARQTNYGSLRKLSASKLGVLLTVSSVGGTYNDQFAFALAMLGDSAARIADPAPIKGAFCAGGGGFSAGIAVMSERQIVAAYPGPSGFLNARILEIA